MRSAYTRGGSISIPEDPESKCPRDHLVEYGADSLSIQELLGVLLFPRYKKEKAIEVDTNLLKAFDGDLIDLFTTTVHQLTQVKEIGFAKACKIKATLELGNRITSYFEEEHPQITSKKDVVKLLASHMKYLKQDEFRVILLNSKRRLIFHQRISLDFLDAVLVEPGQVFRPALAANAKFIILVHNHPSGDPTLYEHDILLTQELCLGGKVLSIEVLDHIIIEPSDHMSMKEKKLM